MEIEDMPISNTVWVDVNKLQANDYNPNVVLTKEMELLGLSILKNGWIQPVLIIDDYTIIDGFHRSTLVKENKSINKLTNGKVPCVMLNITPPQRMLLTIRINRAKGNHIAYKMHDVIDKLVNEYNIPLDTIAKEIGANKDEIDLLLQENVFTNKNIDEETRYTQAWIPQPKNIQKQ